MKSVRPPLPPFVNFFTILFLGMASLSWCFNLSSTSCSALLLDLLWTTGNATFQESWIQSSFPSCAKKSKLIEVSFSKPTTKSGSISRLADIQRVEMCRACNPCQHICTAVGYITKCIEHYCTPQYAVHASWCTKQYTAVVNLFAL